jgi:hypothetical protein
MRNAHKVCSDQMKGRDHLDGLGINWRIILRCMLKTQCGREPCIHVAHDWDYLWALVNTEMNLWFV